MTPPGPTCRMSGYAQAERRVVPTVCAIFRQSPSRPVRSVLLVLLLAITVDAAAQVNTERMRRRLGDDGSALSLDASAAFASGNTEYTLIGLGGRADVQSGRNFAFAVGRLDLSRTGDTSFLDRQFAHVRYNRDLTPWLVAEVFTQAERNRQQKLERRLLGGAGFRAEVIDTDTVGFAIGVTPMVEFERLDASLGEDAAPRARLSTYLSGRLAVSSNTTLTTTTYLQPRADTFEDVRVLSQIALGVSITKYVRLRMSANFRHDTRPPVGVEETDISVENGLVLVIPAAR